VKAHEASSVTQLASPLPCYQPPFSPSPIPSTAPPTIYRKPDAKGWGDTWGGRPVKLISEKP